jgi:CheY-like chemotaxis protein
VLVDERNVSYNGNYMTQILVVEDDDLIARMYEKLFRFEGYDVVLAGNGQEALKMLTNIRPALILLDIMMPVMNGLETLDKIKTDPGLQNIPVIMLTNLAGQQHIDTTVSSGALKYIVKSDNDPKQVLDMVKDVLAVNTGPEIKAQSPPAPPTVAQ